MTSALFRRLDKLEQARSARTPRKSLVLIGTPSDLDRQLREAVAEGRYRAGEPLMRVTTASPPIQPIRSPAP